MSLRAIERGAGLRITTLVRIVDAYEIADINDVFEGRAAS